MKLTTLARAAVLLTATYAGNAAAAEPEWLPVTAADFRADPNVAQRSRDDLDLVARADFNGDGTIDAAQLVKAGDRYGVEARVSAGPGRWQTLLVSSGPLSGLHSVGIGTISRDDALASVARNIAPNREPAEAQAMADRVRGAPSDTLLLVFTYESSATAYVWHGDGFAPVGIGD